MDIIDYQIDNILFSCIIGSNIYCREKKEDKEVYGELRAFISHAVGNYKDLYYLKPIPDDCLDNNRLNALKNMILNPPIKGTCVWPVDIVEFSEPIDFSIAFANEMGRQTKSCKYAFVFSDPGKVGVVPLKRYFRPNPNEIGYDCPEGFCWKTNEKIIKLLLEQLVILQENGYCYPTLSDDNIFYVLENGIPAKAIIDFNCYVFSRKSLIRKSVSIDKQYMDLEYSDMRIVDNSPQIDLFTEAHSLAAILFRLCVGKLPYEGINISAQNASPEEHREWLVQYQRSENQRFIFSKEDFPDYNDGLGLSSVNDEYREYWHGLAGDVQDMFINELRRSNILREGRELVCYTAENWLKAFGLQYNW